jgi:hypothetical protein
MTPIAGVADKVTAYIQKVGEPATLVRLPGRTGTRIELPVKCVVTFAVPTAPTGGVVQGYNEVRIGNNEIAASDWPVPIRRGDQIIIGGLTYTIQGVQTASPGGTHAMHLLYVMGQT